jgi:hypothetical protein
VIARGVCAVAENGVIEKIGKGSQGTVQVCAGLIDPIAFAKNAVCVVQVCVVNTSVLQDGRFVVVNEAGVE